jgi:DNA gyrase subunit B
MKPLITESRVYLACPPLYRATKGKNSSYIKDEQELREYKSKNGSNFTLLRFKGLGEMSHEQLKETVMNPETRTLKQVTIEDAEAAVQIFNIWMGSQPQLRRDFIEANANQVDLD